MSKSRAFVMALGSSVWVLVWGAIFLGSFGGGADSSRSTSSTTSSTSTSSDFLDEWKSRHTPFTYTPHSRPADSPWDRPYSPSPRQSYVPEGSPFGSAGSAFR